MIKLKFQFVQNCWATKKIFEFQNQAAKRSWRVCLEFKSVWYYPKVSPLLTTRQCDISKWQNVRLGVIGGWEYKHRKSRMLKNPSLQYMEAIEQTLKWGGRIGGLLAQSAKLTKSLRHRSLQIILISVSPSFSASSPSPFLSKSSAPPDHLKHWPLATSPPVLYSISYWTFLTSMKRFSSSWKIAVLFSTWKVSPYH